MCEMQMYVRWPQRQSLKHRHTQNSSGTWVQGAGQPVLALALILEMWACVAQPQGWGQEHGVTQNTPGARVWTAGAGGAAVAPELGVYRQGWKVLAALVPGKHNSSSLLEWARQHLLPQLCGSDGCLLLWG